MRITSKGQVTVPSPIRQQLGWHEGTEVDFVVDGNAVRIVRVQGSETHGRALARKLKGRGGASGMSTDELMRLLRAED
ncbi:AbrB/MazE/SpoVT family DNA-binding domain-containing protein [Nocardia terpenica]|uniref:AbrB family transcriptional regulator n=1 Tax=Nocardia terpenica TaxID=455432 RepID=A0A164M5C6_9NOCA|nr:AbrB/MazE/SpoVT family DNA-binding domain-containing protein [Nocardia terpenica]KZM73052.1 AbrB family transcriptional regulator [Nocardia terpenica]MBF6060986.1 AbrB/MazE/SpoVT family DNA-binding domain-containing protein [Nocardia terpenica]MBF6108802.1 AbrB/MazE/SpoVT family DNA-binding domain-containing protein [Nocardia terpenica]MBF6114012.1 AbrB/MazE/SpoVT family DNA-binding domain-containing protein [Nocardia terpenica]MBF6120364.1 AbrB/MazE/SpoVT family DNA-binding domain-containi